MIAEILFATILVAGSGVTVTDCACELNLPECICKPTHDETVKQFDEFFTSNYKLLLGKSNYFFKRYGRDEVSEQLSDAYIKIKKRISEHGYEGDNFMAYTYSTLYNQFRHKQNQQKKFQMRHYEDFESEHLQQEIHSPVRTLLVKYIQPAMLWLPPWRHYRSWTKRSRTVE